MSILKGFKETRGRGIMCRSDLRNMTFLGYNCRNTKQK